MATLLSNVTTDATGTGASHSGPATVYVSGTFDGAFCDIEVSPDDTTYLPVDGDGGLNEARFRTPGTVNIAAHGTYFIRASVRNAGASTSITVVTTV